MAETKVSIPAVYSNFQVAPREDEKEDANFPKTIAEAMILFHRVGKPDMAESLQQGMEQMLLVLSQGPDGKSEIEIGSGCICFECGHVGLPKNNSEACNSKGNDATPSPDFPFVCKKCLSSNSINLIMGRQPDGSILPWIEKSSQP